MQVRDLINLSTRMFRTRPTRTWLTILGISVGISAVLFLVSLGYGLQNIILQKIVFNQALLSLTATPATELIVFDNKALDALRKTPKVVDVAPQASFTAEAVLGELHGTAELRAVDARFFDYAGITTIVGKTFSEGEADQVVVSQAVLKLFGIKNDKDVLGKEINVRIMLKTTSVSSTAPSTIELLHTFKIKGVIEDAQDSFFYLPLFEVAKVTSIERYDQARVRVAASGDLTPVKEVVMSMGYQVASLSETIDQANKIFQIIQIVLGLFGAVALVVSSIGMFNTMTVTLLERTNEIGIMRAIGGSKGNMKTLFISEAIVIGFLGGVVGEVLGIVGAEIFNFGINSLASWFGGAKTDLFYYPTWFLVGIIILSIIIGFLSGVFPARRAANLEPLEALRYK
jgi:putative ABC transport system permease protein